MLPDESIPSTDWRNTTPDYFRAVGIPLIAGRFYTDSDTDTSPRVGMIDERLARLAYPNESPIGKRFRIDFADEPWATIVGVVGHIRHDGLDVDRRPQVYWPQTQRSQDRLALVVRTTAGSEDDGRRRSPRRSARWIAISRCMKCGR